MLRGKANNMKDLQDLSPASGSWLTRLNSVSNVHTETGTLFKLTDNIPWIQEKLMGPLLEQSTCQLSHPNFWKYFAKTVKLKLCNNSCCCYITTYILQMLFLAEALKKIKYSSLLILLQGICSVASLWLIITSIPYSPSYLLCSHTYPNIMAKSFW